MRILSFKVTNFANFPDAVALAPLDEINVLYGANNVGKSNLLRALDLYFQLLGSGQGITKEPVQLIDAPGPELAKLLSTSFNRRKPEPISFRVNWSIPQHELEHWGLLPPEGLAWGQIMTELELKCVNRTYELRLLKWIVKDKDFALLDKAKEGPLVQFGQQIRRLMADATPFKHDEPLTSFRIAGEACARFPQGLCNALFDARQSLAPEQRKRWSLFSRMAGSLEPELGEGAWDTAFDRGTGEASLVYVTGDEAVLVDRLGAGIQRMLTLLAELALAPEPFVAIEEPEFRLSPDLQRRFLGLAARIVESGVGPRQLFFTTHSPIIAGAGKPFAVEVAEGGPVVESKPWVADGMGAPGKHEPSLGGLIGLVEELADVDPDDLVKA
jgi:predicted ATPase